MLTLFPAHSTVYVVYEGMEIEIWASGKDVRKWNIWIIESQIIEVLFGWSCGYNGHFYATAIQNTVILRLRP